MPPKVGTPYHKHRSLRLPDARIDNFTVTTLAELRDTYAVYLSCKTSIQYNPEAPRGQELNGVIEVVDPATGELRVLTTTAMSVLGGLKRVERERGLPACLKLTYRTGAWHFLR